MRALPPSGLLERRFRPSDRRALRGRAFSMQAVATHTAPSTPIEAWQRWGMKVRVEIAPPPAAARRNAHLRHGLVGDVAEVHHRPGLEADRFELAP